MSDQTNAEFAKQDGQFQQACAKADVKPTRRQASKFRNKEGSAYQALYGKSSSGLKSGDLKNLGKS